MQLHSARQKNKEGVRDRKISIGRISFYIKMYIRSIVHLMDANVETEVGRRIDDEGGTLVDEDSRSVRQLLLIESQSSGQSNA